MDVQPREVHPIILASVLGSVLTIVAAAVFRGRAYAGFVGVLLTIHTLVIVGLQEQMLALAPLLIWLHVATLVHTVSLVWARLRPNWYRALVSIPGLYFTAATFLAVPWAIAAAIGLTPYGWWLPFAAAGLGVVQSLRATQEVVDLVLDGEHMPELQRTAVVRRSRKVSPAEGEPLRLVQITDPHLGPFMSVERLRGICERAVEADPHLVLLTGDFFTMEGRGDADLLATALAPLKALEGRTFACFGNHDHEAPRAVADGLAAVGVKLLVDDFTTADTPVGPVQIVGLDHVWAKRSEHYGEVFARLPEAGDALRLVMLHDPGGFKHLPLGESDLVLSGHTHGGHVGLLSLGMNWTSIGAIARMPDHGFWGRGKDRLYVHRANGHYGFPIRVGVPAEESVLRVHRP
ncbi:MAG: metallophosphoesterase [Deltaproteobacteria bacterium]|nr:metallophosphoesterase [Deltaproteobacteria bacterium]